MPGSIIRCEFPDPVMQALSEFELLVKEKCDQIDIKAKMGMNHNVKRCVVMPGVKNDTLAEHLRLNAARLSAFAGRKGGLETIRRAGSGPP